MIEEDCRGYISYALEIRREYFLSILKQKGGKLVSIQIVERQILMQS